MYTGEFGVIFRGKGKLPLSSNLLPLKKIGKILTMPRNRDYISASQKKRNLIKCKTSNGGPAGICYLQFLGSGAIGAPKSLFFFSDNKRFIFNVGEGTQRIAHEHKIKIARMEHIFITYPIWENIGGLPGLCLTLQECGVPELTVHGPKGLSSIFDAAKRFVVLNNLNIQSVICERSKSYEDGSVNISYVPLISKNLAALSESESCSLASIIGDIDSIKDEVDYYAHLKGTNTFKANDTSSMSNTASLCSNILPASSPISMAYICSLAPKKGALNLEKCVDLRVPPGPLLGKLKNGEDVTLPDGTVVKSVDVCAPDQDGPSFIIIDCPTIDFLDSLIEEESFRKFQTENCNLPLMYVIHFTLADVMNDPRYQEWMRKFPKNTLHVNANDKNKCLGCVSVHDIQFKLNLLDPKVFPLLADNSIPTFHVNRFKNNSLEDILETVKKNSQSEELDRQLVRRTDLNLPDDCVHTLRMLPLRPRDYVERFVADCVYLDPRSSVMEVMEIPSMEEELNSLKTNVEQLKPTVDAIQQQRPHPIITFLGTGSCIPNKYRSTSAILVSLSDDNHLLMDCSEGTFGQLVRHFGVKRAEEILSNLNIIYISHLHADHHIGLINILKHRREAVKPGNKVLLLAPKPILFWLASYHQQFEEIFDCMEFISNSDLEYRNRYDSSIEKILKVAPLKDIETSYVVHCPQAFGVSFTHANGCKITYSGDTMPSKDLINIGKNSDLLVHEATFEDSLIVEARQKFHSTTSEALEVGKKMEAKFVLLTHFSQRYAKLPLITNDFIENVGVAFDNMQISLSDLPKLHLYNSALKIIFEEEVESIKAKCAKRKRSIND